MNSLTNKKIVATCLSLFILLSGCDQSVIDSLPTDDGSNSNGEPVAFSISLSNTPEYNDPNSASPASRSGEPILSEWVGVNPFSMTRNAKEDSQAPKIALMELYEDSVPVAHTRGVMPNGNYFRLIAFRKIGDNNYVFQSVADYTSNGSFAPVLVQGKMLVPRNQIYRFVAYSFNNNTAMGALPNNYSWNSTQISIPDMNNDFVTFVSGDIELSTDTYVLSVSFSHQLTKLTVKPVVNGIGDNSFSNCTGVYISQGGSSTSWKVGKSTIETNSSNSASFSIPINGTYTIRLVPKNVSSQVSVYIGSITVGGIQSLSNLTVKSSQSIKMASGRSYTMTVQFKKKVGIQVPESDINFGASCTEQDKKDLAKLTWAVGNLRQQGDDGTGSTIMTSSQSEYGHYYTWNSTYTGNTSSTGTDPCSTLGASTYGAGWRTPNKNELEKLSRCTDQQLVVYNSVKGMWFMNNTKGLFLPAAGDRDSFAGSGTMPTYGAGTYGGYWSSDAVNSSYAYLLYFSSGNAYVGNSTKTNGLSVRCVQGDKQ